MGKELLLLEELCKELGYSVIFEEEQSIATGEILTPTKYTLIEKPAVSLPVDGDVWGAMVEYILDHKDDIESEVNDYGKLMPVLDYFSRNCTGE